MEKMLLNGENLTIFHAKEIVDKNLKIGILKAPLQR